MPHVVPKLPPRYANAKPIGGGGMGDVFAASDLDLDRRVAVKVLVARFADDESCRKRFKREALAAARLSGHPHVVTIHDVGEWEGRPFIVMQLLAGGTVAERLKAGDVRRSEALRWLEQTAQALDDAHAQALVHRDVKPANLLLDARGDVHVADFGIARILDASTGGITETGSVLGTAGYLSPEQASGKGSSSASDVYSLGVVAYELLVGRRPFKRQTPTAEAAAHIREPVPPASEQSDLPRAVDAVFARALAKDPGARYRSARELVTDLEDALAAGEQETLVLTAPVAVVAAPPRRRYGPIVAVALGLLLLGGGALAGAVVAGGDEEKPRVKKVVRTLTRTLPGTTVRSVRTVTAAAPASPLPPPPPPPPPPQPPPPPPPAPSTASGQQLTDEGYALMNEGRYSEALPVLQQAVSRLDGTGEIYEAYADYNLAYTLIHLGRCSEAVPLLDESEQLQGHRDEIDAARAQAASC